jgi:hypothetical protein
MLNVGDRLPDISLKLPGGGTANLPPDFLDTWVYFAIFRGYW